MQHHIRRWHRDHSGELISAWLNGVGMMVWEVVFGAWVGWNERDAATLRRMLPVQRRLHRWLVDGEWTPARGVRAVGPRGVDVRARGHDARRSWRTRRTRISRIEPEVAGRWIPLHDVGGGCVRRGVIDHGARPWCRRSAERDCGGGRSRRAWTASGRSSPGASTWRMPRSRIAALAACARRRGAGPSADAEVSRASAGGSRSRSTPGERVITVRYRQRETGMYEGAPYVDEWKPLPPAPARPADAGAGRRAARRAPRRGPRGVGCRVRGVPRRDRRAGASGCFARPPRHRGDLRACPRVRRVGGRAPADGGRVAARRDGGRIPPPHTGRLELDRVRAQRRPHAVRHAQGRLGPSWPRSPTGTSTAGCSIRNSRRSCSCPGLGVDASPSIGFRVCWEEDAAWARSTG